MTGLKPEIVIIDIGQEKFELTPCTGALIGISQTLEGPLGALRRLQGMDVLAVSNVIAAGAELDSAAAKDLPDKIFESGQLEQICADAVRFCLLLMNAGKARTPADKSPSKAGNEKKQVH
ncbi:hypothetical protein [Nisaea nitritireducens]|uniref:hypothetical protein n=1 Tax=Nisaea nitritireducens TaxID=568392 RepID=UPI001865ACD9|nr:hypothetical protein [Nisaea nitritireducens]